MDHHSGSSVSPKTHYTTASLAKFVGVSERTIERWWKAGKLPQPEMIRRSDGTKFWNAAQARKVLEERRITTERHRHPKGKR